MANYADYLAHLNIDIVYNPTDQNTNADYSSRISSTSMQSGVNSLSVHGGGNVEDEFDQLALHGIQQLPVRADHIARETRKDSYLGQIVQELESGHNLAQSEYKAPEVKYTLAANCLLFEDRVVSVSSVLQQAILNDLHVAPLGVVKMKGLA